MIIMYKNLTGRIYQAHYVADENVWSNEECTTWNSNNPGNTAVVVPDRKGATGCYFHETSGQVQTANEFDVTLSKNTILDNGTDYAEFSNLPEGTRVNIDETYIGDVDDSGIFRFTSTEVGSYWIQLEKYAYLEYTTEVTVNASI